MPRTILVALSLLLVTGCIAPQGSGPRPAPPTPEEGLAAFTSVLGELEAAVRATPRWETDAEAALRVRGLADLALTRLDALEPYAADGAFSAGALALLRLHVRDVATPGTWGPHIDRGADLALPTDEQLEAAADEKAWARTVARLDALERYVADGMPVAVAEEHVMPMIVEDLFRVRLNAPASRRLWKKASPDEDAFREVWSRATRLLIAIGRRSGPVEGGTR